MSLYKYFIEELQLENGWWNNRMYISGPNDLFTITEHSGKYYFAKGKRFPYYSNEIKSIEDFKKKVQKLIDGNNKTINSIEEQNNILNDFLINPQNYKVTPKENIIEDFLEGILD